MATARSRPQSLAAIIDGYIDPTRTEYRGVLMRSRLEADFARHLDAQQIAWRYEPAIFGPPGAGYLPDFQLLRDDGPHFLEVKPTLREVPEAKRRMAVILATHPDAVLIIACAEESRYFASVAGGEWISWVERWSHG
jgi:hypothetical protein